MSAKERDRLKVLHEVGKRHITQKQAGVELGLSERWVRTLLRRLRREGDKALRHRLRHLSIKLCLSDSCGGLETRLEHGIELVKYGSDILGQAFPFALLERRDGDAELEL